MFGTLSRTLLRSTRSLHGPTRSVTTGAPSFHALRRLPAATRTTGVATGTGTGTNFFHHPTSCSFSSSRTQAETDAETTEKVNNILYNTPAVGSDLENKYTLSVLVDNEAGVLSKVSGLLAGRGFNIDSLTVSTTDVSALSRMTIVLNGPQTQMEQARKQLEDLVHVWAVIDSGRNNVNREMALIKLSTLPPAMRPTVGESVEYVPTYEDLMESRKHRDAVVATCDLFGSTVVDVGTDQMIVELVSWSRRIDAFIRTMKPYGVIEVARSGAITMPRVPVAGQTDGDEGSPNQATDISALPPS